MLKVEMLGHFILIAPAGEVVLPTAKMRLLAAYLVWQQGRWVTRDSLRGMFWGDVDEKRASGSLRTALYSLRRVLAEHGVTASLVEIRREAVRVSAGAGCWVDAREFEKQAWAGLRGTAEIDSLMAATALYHGDFLSEMDADWCLAERERLANLHRGVLRALTERLVANGLLEAASSYARQWLAADPLDEAAHQILMRLYVGMGRPALAAAQFENCFRILQNELGVGPSEATLRLYQELGLAACKKNSGPPEAKWESSDEDSRKMVASGQLSPEPLREARLLLMKGEAMCLKGENAEGLALLEKALAIYGRFGGLAAKARILLGEVLLWLSVPLTPFKDRELRLKAIAHLEHAAEYYRASGPISELGRALFWIAVAYWMEGQNQEAALAAQEGLDLVVRIEDPELETLLAAIQGMILRERFLLDEARAAFVRAVNTMPGLTNNWQILWLIFQRGILSYIIGDLAEAEEFLGEAVAFCRSIVFPTLQVKMGECMTRSMMLVVLHYQNRRLEMEEFRIPPELEKYTPEPFIYLNPLFYRAKDPAILLPSLADWLRARLYRLPQPMVACTLRVVVEEMLAFKMWGEAARWSAVGLRLARVRGWFAIQALFYCHRAVSLARLGRLRTAEVCLRRAERLTHPSDRWTPAWRAWGAGLVALGRGDIKAGREYLQRARRLFLQINDNYDARQVALDAQGSCGETAVRFNTEAD